MPAGSVILINFTRDYQCYLRSFRSCLKRLAVCVHMSTNMLNKTPEFDYYYVAY